MRRLFAIAVILAATLSIAHAINILNLPQPLGLVATGSGAGTATCSPACDGQVVTTTSLTTAAGATAVLTVNNGLIQPNSLVLATVYNGTNTGGVPVIAGIVPTFGSVAITILNSDAGFTGATVFNGTLKVNFIIFN